MKPLFAASGVFLALLAIRSESSPAPTAAPLATAAATAEALAPLPLDGFADCIHHWQNSHHTKDYPRLAPADMVGIAENILLYQRDNGGWRENEDPLRILSGDEKKQILADRPLLDTSLDNRNCWPQVEYLAGAFGRTRDERYRAACLRGLAFIFSAQHSSGGFPHSFPSKEDYRPHLTFADDVLPDILRMLNKVAHGAEPFGFGDAALRARAAESVRRGNACILKLQLRVKGELTVWAGQYHCETLQPTQARAFELPSLVSRESVAVTRYLMSIENPSPEVVRAVDAAVAWFDRSKIKGLRLERFDADPVKYTWHTSTADLRTVADPAAPPLWSRFYEIETNQPFLANRDGQKVYTLAEVARERRTGYDWYGTWPAELIEKDYPAWKARLEAEKTRSTKVPTAK